MKLYGIFDKNQNYKLLRYSDIEQTSLKYRVFDPVNKTYSNEEVEEVCLPDIDYSSDNIGKNYDINTGQFIG